MYNLRKVTKDDIKLLFDWINDPDARANAKNSDLIKWEDHVVWFNNKMSEKYPFIYILTDEEKNIGIVRFDKKIDNFIISYFIDKDYRGRGLGGLVLREGLEKLHRIVDNAILLAYVKKGNIASEKIFKKLEFDLERKEKINNIDFNVYKRIR